MADRGGWLGLALCLLTVPAAAEPTRGPVAVASDAPTDEGPVLYERAVAVVVGVDAYGDASHDLEYAVHDARGVAEMLGNRFEFDEVRALYDEQASRQGVVDLFTELRGLGRDDALFVFWAGHGVSERLPRGGDVGYLVPSDGSFVADEYVSRNLSMRMLREDLLARVPAKHVFLVVDACYGGLFQSTRAVESAGDLSEAYLADIAQEPVVYALSAGQPDQQVLDGGPGGHSVFTGRFLQKLGQVQDLATASEIASWVERRVSSDAAMQGHVQRPMWGRLDGVGDFVFRVRDADLQVPASLAPPPSAASTLPAAPALVEGGDVRESPFWGAVQDAIERSATCAEGEAACVDAALAPVLALVPPATDGCVWEDLALEVRVRAQVEDNAQVHALAARVYERAVAECAEVDHAYLDYIRADSLRKAGETELSDAVYAELADSDRFGDAAAFFRLENARVRAGDPSAVKPSPEGTLPQAWRTYVERAGLLLDRALGEPADDVVDLRPFVERSRHKYEYIAGQVLAGAGLHDEARGWFERVLAGPPSLESSYALGLLVDAEIEASDYQGIVELIDRYLPRVPEGERDRFQSTYLAARFKRALSTAKQDAGAGAQAFVAYREVAGPGGPFTSEAVYNALYYGLKSGSLDVLATAFPFAHELAGTEYGSKMSLGAARFAEERGELHLAAEAYQTVADHFEGEPDAVVDALRQASRLRALTGERRAAAVLLERALDLEDSPSAADLLAAAALWESDDPVAAIRRYRSILRDWPDSEQAPRAAERLAVLGPELAPVTARVGALEVGVTEVDRTLWRAVMGTEPSHRSEMRHSWDEAPARCDQGGEGEDLPVVCVTWLEAVQFANALSELVGLDPAYALPEMEGEHAPVDLRGEVRRMPGSTGYRLPTAAEFEAIAAELPRPRCKRAVLGGCAGVVGLSGTTTGKASRAGLHHVWGNAAEWLSEPFADDPVLRAFAGGSWAADELGPAPDAGGADRRKNVGLRLVRDAAAE